MKLLIMNVCYYVIIYHIALLQMFSFCNELWFHFVGFETDVDFFVRALIVHTV